MPIRPENRDRYPADWEQISLAQKQAAGWRCVCRGECGRPADHLDPADGRCRNRHGERAWTGDDDQPHLDLGDLADDVAGGVVVVLTTGHRNHIPEDCRPENLAAWCPGCHLHYDRDHHAQTRHQTRGRDLAAGMNVLFEIT